MCVTCALKRCEKNVTFDPLPPMGIAWIGGIRGVRRNLSKGLNICFLSKRVAQHAIDAWNLPRNRFDWSCLHIWTLGDMSFRKQFCWVSDDFRIPSKKKYKERRRKGAPLIMSRSSKNGTPILKERRFSGILYWCDWGAPNGAPNGVISGAPFLLRF